LILIIKTLVNLKANKRLSKNSEELKEEKPKDQSGSPALEEENRKLKAE